MNLYALGAEHCGRVRLGVTNTTVAARLQILQRDCPDDLRVLGWSPSHGHLERRLHAALARWRVRGDWYEPAVGLAIASSGDFGRWVDAVLGERAPVACACGTALRELSLTCGAAACVRAAKGLRTGVRPLIVGVG